MDQCSATPEPGYPTICPKPDRIGVCKTQLTNDAAVQRETSIAIVNNNCARTLIGSWIDDAVGHHIAVVRSEDGFFWDPPAATACALPVPPATGARRTVNDCYFTNTSGSWQQNCPGFVIPPSWKTADEAVAAGAGGMGYFAIGSVGVIPPPPGYSSNANTMLFARTSTAGAGFDLFNYPALPPGSGTISARIKHVCEVDQYIASSDRNHVVASPVTPGKLALAWNYGKISIEVFLSSDFGDTFQGDMPPVNKPTQLQATVPQREVNAPHGAYDDSDNLYLVWTYTNDPISRVSDDVYIHGRRRCPSGCWQPPIGPYGACTAAYQLPFVVAGSFKGMGGYAVPGFNEDSATSIAVDRTRLGLSNARGPRNGWIYVVYVERQFVGTDAHRRTRVRLARSCDRGATWSPSIEIDSDSGNPHSSQLLPQVAVDGLGGVGILWYDTRNWTGSVLDDRKYDIYFKYLPEGQISTAPPWNVAKRISTGAVTPAFETLGFQEPLGEYSGLAADPADGTAVFHALVMGRPNVPGSNLDIYSYQIVLRKASDMDGDNDVDWGDYALLTTCATSGGPNCYCAAGDMNGDGAVTPADLVGFDARLIETGCLCRGACQVCPDCSLECELPEPLALTEGSSFASLPTGFMGAGCVTAEMLARHLPEARLFETARALRALLDREPGHADAALVAEILACLQGYVPTS